MFHENGIKVLRRCTSVRHAVKAQSLGVWSVGTAMGLINDIPTVGELVARMVVEADELITGRLAGMIELD
jgi:NAD(P)H-dependent flavin oxidoreductase YrpB (nitropropane dioxygenase family)